MNNFTRVIYGWLITFLCCMTAVAQDPNKEAAKAAKVTSDLYRVMVNNSQSATNVIDGFEVQTNIVFKNDRIAIEAVSNNGDGQALLDQLKELGLTEGVAYKRIIFGYLPVDKIGELKNVSLLSFARPYYEPITNTGSVTSQGDVALKANVARTTYGVTGTGVKVGVISDSYNRLGGAAAGVASGDLPTGVQVLLEPTSGGTDEGRAMAEIVHDVAPGAGIAFSTANGGEATFAQSILNLAAASCQIIVDDIIYLSEPFFQDGIVAQAVNQVVNNGVTYFSSAGNRVRASYQAPYKSGGTYGAQARSTHNFSSGTVDNLQRISIPPNQSLRLVFQWDNPFQSVSGGTGATTDLDIYVLNPTTGAVITSGTNNQTNGGDPIEITGTVTNTTTSPRLVDVVIVKAFGPDPGLIKWVNFGGNNISPEYATNSGASFGHNSSVGAISVGAAGYFATPAYNNAVTATIEPFSSAGGTPILFNTDGSRINGIAGTVRQKPEITAVDGGDNTFFGNDYESNGRPNFFGTSAAAPHAAAVAALMKQKVPSITRNTILSTLESTALDMDDPATSGFDTGFDYGTGFGFIQADRALQAISAINAPVAPAIASQTATVGVTFSYVVPAFSGTAPITYSASGLPSGLNFDAGSRTISGTPTTAQVASVTVTGTNSAGSGNGVFTITVNAPAATAPVAPAIASQTATVGVTFSYVVPAFSGTEPITYSASGLPSGLSFDAGSRTISGTPTTAQVSSVTVTGTNSAGSGSGVFTITVNAPAATAPVAPAIANQTAIVGVAFSYVVPAFSGTTPITYSASGLPSGLIFDASSRTISGIPTTAQVASVTVTGTNSAGSANALFTITVNAPAAIAPVAPVIASQTATVGVTFSYVVPDFSGTEPITYSTSGLPSGLSFDAGSRTISGTPTTAQVASVTVTGTNSAGSGSGVFTITVNAAPVSGTFAIISVNTISCENVSAGQRRVTFTPVYSGLNGQPVTFRVRNESAPTTAAGPYSLVFYTDNPTVTLQATQAGSSDVATFSYNWLSACANPTPTPPVAPAIHNQTATVGSFFSYVVPAFTGTEPITYAAAGLPAGLNFDAANHLINGTPTTAQVSSVTVTGTNSAGSSNAVFTITVSASAVSTNFAITSVNTISCESVSAGQRRVTFTPVYSGLNGQPVTFQVRNESAPTTAAGPYSLVFYTDNSTVTLQATQAGSSDVATFSYNWLSACANPTPTPPVAPAIPNQTATVGSFFSYVVPAFTGTEPITYAASGLPAGLNFDAVNHLINGTPTTAQVSSVTVTGTNSAGSSNAIFTITVSASAVSTNFAITSVNTISCESVSAGQRRVTFTPVYSGLNGQPVTFQVRNESAPTTAAGPYSLVFYTDNPTVTLQAIQAGSSDVATFSYNWLAGCNSPARLMQEASQKLSVTVLGNPVLNETVSVELRGANDQPVVLRSVDSQGRTIQTITVERAVSVERVDVKIGRSPGMYILHVNTPSQQKAVKLMKQ